MKQNQGIRREINNEPWENTPKPWETVPGPSKSIPRAWILSANVKIPPQNAFSAVLGSENHKKASADQLKTLYKTKLFAHPRKNQGFQEKSGIPRKNQGFLENIRGSEKKSGIPRKNQGFLENIKRLHGNIKIRAPAQKAYKTQGKWSKFKGFEEKSTTNHGKTLPKPWETVPGPSKSIPRAWILSENEKIPPQNAFSALPGSANNKKASADQLKTLYKTKLFAHPRKIRDSKEKTGLPRKNGDS